ncbi:MAG: glycosyltransferase, partial [Candidatus Brocadiales bacterium]|nr:glycosyltransferase [Candidatus Bathyanammoxibius sp.]
MLPGISIILPAFNEAENIVQATREVLAYCRQAGIEHEVIIVNDGSLDVTGPLADRLEAENTQVRVIHHPINEG